MSNLVYALQRMKSDDPVKLRIVDTTFRDGTIRDVDGNVVDVRRDKTVVVTATNALKMCDQFARPDNFIQIVEDEPLEEEAPDGGEGSEEEPVDDEPAEDEGSEEEPADDEPAEDEGSDGEEESTKG